jgi:hypothetical protein
MLLMYTRNVAKEPIQRTTGAILEVSSMRSSTANAAMLKREIVYTFEELYSSNTPVNPLV